MYKELTLIIPTKHEKESIAHVIKEIKLIKIKTIFVLESGDFQTINTIKQFKSYIYFQKKRGYGQAIIEGLKLVKTKYFCIFNADGSFNPNEIKKMLTIAKVNNYDLVFGSRYEKNCGSDDDTIITRMGNFFFTKLGNLLFKIGISDILYTFVLGKTKSISDLKLKEKDFKLCVELPIKAKVKNLKLSTNKSFERARLAGKKKVKAFSDGLKILHCMLKIFILNAKKYSIKKY